MFGRCHVFLSYPYILRPQSVSNAQPFDPKALPPYFTPTYSYSVSILYCNRAGQSHDYKSKQIQKEEIYISPSQWTKWKTASFWIGEALRVYGLLSH